MDLPTVAELQALRAGLRKRKTPYVFDGMWCSEPGIGGMRATQVGYGLEIEWVTFTDGVKSQPKKEFWIDLCSNSELEMKRLEVGYVVAAICDHNAQTVMNSVGGPMEALQESAPYRELADSWRHWALVPAGHMLLDLHRKQGTGPHNGAQ